MKLTGHLYLLQWLRLSGTVLCSILISIQCVLFHLNCHINMFYCIDVFVIFCYSLGCPHFCHPSARDTGNDEQIYDRSHTNLGETVRYVPAVDKD